jgi:hypothetical protein
MLTSWREYETKIEVPLNQLRDQLHALEHVVFLRANTELPGCLE